MALKMKQHHLDYLSKKIEVVLNHHGRETLVTAYEAGNFPRADAVNDLQTRFNRDILNAAVSAAWIVEELHPYLTDSHIDSALRYICPRVTRR